MNQGKTRFYAGYPWLVSAMEKIRRNEPALRLAYGYSDPMFYIKRPWLRPSKVSLHLITARAVKPEPPLNSFVLDDIDYEQAEIAAMAELLKEDK